MDIAMEAFVLNLFDSAIELTASNVQNWNRHRANDCVAVGPQMLVIWAAAGNEQVCFSLLHSLAQHLGHVTTSYKLICLDAHLLLKLCQLLRSSSLQTPLPTLD